jgi:hypothetical protein
MLTVIGLLVIAAFVITLLSAIGKAPLWVAVLLLTLVHLLGLVPLGR